MILWMNRRYCAEAWSTFCKNSTSTCILDYWNNTYWYLQSVQNYQIQIWYRFKSNKQLYHNKPLGCCHSKICIIWQIFKRLLFRIYWIEERLYGLAVEPSSTLDWRFRQCMMMGTSKKENLLNKKNKWAGFKAPT